MVIAQYTLRLALAFLFGAMIGVERQTRQKTAGLRTNTLVSLGSAAFILLSYSLTDGAGDPSRIAAQVVSGVGFLGGGLILKDGFNVRGLNTAATIWCSAAVGSLAGAGLYIQSMLLVVCVLCAHCLLRPLGDILSRHNCFKGGNAPISYMLKIRCKEQIENHLRVMILNTTGNDPHLQMRSLRSSDDEILDYCFIVAEIYAQGKHDIVIEKLAAKLTIEYGVTQVSWETTNPPEEG